jgi:hypothetical protein
MADRLLASSEEETAARNWVAQGQNLIREVELSSYRQVEQAEAASEMAQNHARMSTGEARVIAEEQCAEAAAWLLQSRAQLQSAQTEAETAARSVRSAREEAEMIIAESHQNFDTQSRWLKAQAEDFEARLLAEYRLSQGQFAEKEELFKKAQDHLEGRLESALVET